MKKHASTFEQGTVIGMRLAGTGLREIQNKVGISCTTQWRLEEKTNIGSTTPLRKEGSSHPKSLKGRNSKKNYRCHQEKQVFIIAKRNKKRLKIKLAECFSFNNSASLKRLRLSKCKKKKKIYLI